MQFLTSDMILRLILYPAAMMGAVASCWLILKPLLRRGTAKEQAEAIRMARLQATQPKPAEVSLSSEFIASRLRK